MRRGEGVGGAVTVCVLYVRVPVILPICVGISDFIFFSLYCFTPTHPSLFYLFLDLHLLSSVPSRP